MSISIEKAILLHLYPWLNSVIAHGLGWWHQPEHVELLKRELPLQLLEFRDYGFLPRMGGGLSPTLRDRSGRLFFAVSFVFSEEFQRPIATAYMLDFFPNSLDAQLHELREREIPLHYLVESWEFQIEGQAIVRRPYVVMYPLFSQTTTEYLLSEVHFLSLVELVIRSRSTKF